jgi:hypothetical protein
MNTHTFKAASMIGGRLSIHGIFVVSVFGKDVSNDVTQTSLSPLPHLSRIRTSIHDKRQYHDCLNATMYHQDLRTKTP